MRSPFRLVHWDRFSKKESRTLHVLGVVLFFVSLLMIPSLVMSILQGESVHLFLWPMLGGLIVSVFLTLYYRNPSVMRPADGLFMIFVLWVSLFLFGTLPFLIHGIPLVDAFFESVSGFTTAGATNIPNLIDMPTSLLLWRSMTQWIGGIIIVTVFMFIMPMVVTGGRSLLTNEMSGSGGGNLYLKMSIAAKQYILVYLVLTAIYFVILLLLGLTPFESINIAMCVICTGGFMITNDSFSNYDVPVRLAVMFFMLFSATNFYLQYRAVVKHETKGFRLSEEFNIMCIWLFSISVLICLMMGITGSWTHESSLVSIVDVFFSIVAIGTTTGFTTLDYTTQWPFLGLSLLFLMMFIGGSTGSTSGGIKIARGVVMLRSMVNEIRHTLHPNAVYSVKFDRKGLDDDIVHSSIVIVLMFAITIFGGMIVFDNIMKMDEALFASAALVTGTGPGMGSLFGDYSSLPNWAKLFSCVLMFLGRMEIISVLVFFTPGFWKEFIGASRLNAAKEHTKAKVKEKLSRKKNPEGPAEEVPEEEIESTEDLF